MVFIFFQQKPFLVGNGFLFAFNIIQPERIDRECVLILNLSTILIVILNVFYNFV